MRCSLQDFMLPSMDFEVPIVLRLELDGCGEAIKGRLTAQSGWAMPFVGWLGLAAAIEQATQKMRDEPS